MKKANRNPSTGRRSMNMSKHSKRGGSSLFSSSTRCDEVWWARTHTDTHTHTQMCIQPSSFQAKQPTSCTDDGRPLTQMGAPKNFEFHFRVLKCWRGLGEWSPQKPPPPFSGGKALRPFCLWP